MGIGYGYLQESLDINMGLSKREPIDITDNVVTSGDGLYQDQYEPGRYVYRGSNPNNYIMFNDELWRIIAKEADGTYKIIRDEWLPNRTFDEANNRLTISNTYCDNPSNGCSVYGAINGTYTLGSKSGTVTEDSSIAEYLNGEYYNSLTPIAKGQIQTHTFNIGGVLYLVVDSITNNLQQEKVYTWTGNIGLPNVTDILRASLNPSCTSATDTYYPNYNKCTSNYFVDDMETNTYYWTINGYSSEFTVYSYNVWAVDRVRNGVYLNRRNAGYSVCGVRPTLYLKSTIQIMSGDGTKSNPYIIAE